MKKNTKRGDTVSDVQVIKANSNRINRKTSKVIERIRVAAYCRVSTDSEEQLTSYNSQVLHYKNLVESNPEWDLVDIFADENLFHFYQGSELIYIFERILNRYSINLTKLFSYAKRRKKEQEIKQFISIHIPNFLEDIQYD